MPNVVYANRDYALPGSVDGRLYPGVTRGEYVHPKVLEESIH
jgi:endoglucanase